jgi:UPF0716 protein FxsA
MVGVLALAFLAIPIVEIWLIVQAGRAVGGLATVTAVIAIALAGAALARHQGLAAVRQLQRALATGERVGRSVAEAALVLVAAVLMIAPGFLTDAVGLLLLVPPVRAAAASALIRWGAARFESHAVFMPPARGFDRSARAHHDDQDPPPPGVIDV